MRTKEEIQIELDRVELALEIARELSKRAHVAVLSNQAHMLRWVLGHDPEPKPAWAREVSG